MNGIDTNSTSGFHTIDEWLEMNKANFHMLRLVVSVEKDLCTTTCTFLVTGTA